MAKIPNQNTIVETIKANVDSIEKVINIIVTSADAVAAIAPASMKNINTYSVTLNTLFAKDGICTVITSAVTNMANAANAKFNRKAIKRLRHNIYVTINEIKDIVAYLSENGSIDMPKTNLAGFNGLIKAITDVIALANEDTIKLSWFKMQRIKRLIRRIVNSINSMQLDINTDKLTTAKKGFDAFFAIFNGVTAVLNKIKIVPLVYIKLNIMNGMVERISLICGHIANIDQKTLDDVQTKSKVLETIFKALQGLFGSIHKIFAGVLLQLTLKNISKSIALINNIVTKLGSIKINKNVEKKIAQLTLIFTSLSILFLAISLMTPIWFIGLIATFILLGVIKLFHFAMRYIIATLVKLATKQAMKGMLALLVIGLLLTSLAAMFLFLATIAENVVKQSLWILALLGVIIGVTLLVAGFGLVCAVAWIPFLAALAGLAMVTIAIGLITVIALLLTLLQKINLDGKKIKENVSIVIGTAMDIITNIFRPDEQEDEESDKGWIATILGFVGGAIAPVIQAIMAVAFLALLTVGIACILLIAGMLRLIQELDLNPSKIKTNVKIVIDTAMLVVKTIFEGKDQNAKESNKSWIASVIEFMGGTLVTIIKAVLAVAFLALALVAILFILLIAAQLRLLQELALDPTLISNNVNTVINTAIYVANALYDRPENPDNPTGKGFLSAIINFCCPALGAIIDALFAIAFLAVSIIAISLVLVLASQLRLLQDIPLDPALITANVTTVIETCQYVVDAIMDRKDKPDDPSSKGWIRKLFEWIGMDGLIQIIECIMALAWLGMTVAIISMITMLANHLKTLQDIDLDSSAIKAKTLAVCNTADAVCGVVLGRKNPISGSSSSSFMKLLKWLFPALAEAIEMMSKMKWVSGIMSTVGVVRQVADTLMTLINLPDVTPVKSKVKYVCDTADQIVAMVTSRPSVSTWDDAKSRMSWMNRITETVNRMSKISPAGINKTRKALGGFIQFVNKVNAVDVEKLETSARMFQQMAKFSNSIHGDFQKLAETLAEDLMPVLQELKEIMGVLPEKLDTGFQNTSASIAATTVAPTQSSMTEQVARENPNMDKQQVDQLVQRRLKEYSKNESNGVVAKMDQLINLLKGYSGDKVKVQTV